MMDDKHNIAISELARLSGVPASTIRFYLREGLISSPLKKGKTRAYFSKDHITQLKKLKKLRDRDRLSINEIKHAHGIFTPAETADESGPLSSSDRKDDIITSAIELFREKGYDTISITDIAERASISKATFYKHFSCKEDLFYECADRVFENIDNEYRATLSEKDITERFILRGILFIKKHRHMIDMLNVARGTSGAASPRNREKATRIMANLIAPIWEDLEEGIRQGVFRTMNTHAVAHMLMGVAEYGVYFCEGKNTAEIDQFARHSVALIMQGLIKNPGGRR